MFIEEDEDDGEENTLRITVLLLNALARFCAPASAI